MVPLDEPEFERWRTAAATALASARSQKEAGFHGWACFMCEQAAQFGMKGLLHASGRGEKTHDLLRLWNDLREAGIDLSPRLEDSITPRHRRRADGGRWGMELSRCVEPSSGAEPSANA